MDEKAAVEVVRSVALEVLGKPNMRLEQVDLDCDLSDLGLDSATSLELAGRLEEKFGCEFRDGDLARVARLRDLVSLVVLAGRR